jgi:hypothetical protein
MAAALSATLFSKAAGNPAAFSFIRGRKDFA